MLKKRLTEQRLIWFVKLIQLVLFVIVFWMGYTAIGFLPEFAAWVGAITTVACAIIGSASVEVIE
jgi:hypothetical protein